MALSSLVNTIPNQASWNWGATGHPTSPAIFGTLPGAQPFNYSPSQGGIPQVPNPAATQNAALQGNLSNLGDIEALTQAINQMEQQFAQQQNQLNQQQATWNTNLANQQAQFYSNLNRNTADVNNAQAQAFAQQADELARREVQAQLEANIPGYGGLIGQRSHNIGQQLAGQVPQDVIAQLWRQGAERGTGGGFGIDSPAANAAYMQALGTNSLAQIAAGNQNLQGAITSAPTAPITQPQFSAAPFASAPNIQAPYSSATPFNPSGLLLDPNQMQEWQYLANMLSAAPVPAAAAQSNLSNLMAAMRMGQGLTAPYSQGSPQGVPQGGTMTPPPSVTATTPPTTPGQGTYSPFQASDEAFYDWMGWNQPVETPYLGDVNIPTDYYG